ncbi:MAG: hypothetical protein AAF214_04205 [Pseudomonadota bacterium]
MLLHLLPSPRIKQRRTGRNLTIDARNGHAVGLLFLATLPLAHHMMEHPDVINLVMCGTLLAFYIGALCAISLGLRDAQRYHSQTIARAARYKGRIIGSAGLGLAVGLTTTMRGGSVEHIVLFGALTTGLSLITFGIDPLQDKGFGTNTQDKRRQTAPGAHSAA